MIEKVAFIAHRVHDSEGNGLMLHQIAPGRWWALASPPRRLSSPLVPTSRRVGAGVDTVVFANNRIRTTFRLGTTLPQRADPQHGPHRPLAGRPAANARPTVAAHAS